MKYGYELALEKAGAIVHAYKEFGSWQGDWWAHVTHDDRTGFVHGYFGSCTVCDAFSAEFGYDAEEEPDYEQRLAAFGRDYLEVIHTPEQAVAAASEDLEWDLDAQKVVDWIKAQMAFPCV